MIRSRLWYALALVGAGLVGCGGDDEEEKPAASCSLTGESGCTDGKVCEEVQGAEPQCFAPISIKGKVFDALDESAIEGAHVVARDANDVAISPVAVTDAMGNYSLQVPAKRNADGTIVDADATLRADALGYQTFPTAPRTALPIDLTTATGDPAAIQNAATDIALIPLSDMAGLGSISGKVTSDNPGGTLVTASSVTGLADRDGDYTIFNVPAGTGIEVKGYAPGVNLETKTADVTAGMTTPNINLDDISAATAKVTGNVQIVNPGDGSDTSVILVVEDTFVENAARGEAPPGLRAYPVSGAFEIPNVPDGKYVVLAAFENDFLVRDPDTSIAGTDIVHITVAGADVAISEGFKITGALNVISPGADALEAVSGTPTFTWEDDSSEDSYEVQVFDAFGNEIWTFTEPGHSGGKDVALDYGGDPLTSGMIYQFRVTSIKDGVPISRTEDLKGVFMYQ